MRRSLHIILAVSLLFLSWLDLAHHLDTHAHQPGQVCQFCLFTANIGHGTPASVAILAPPHIEYYFVPRHYLNPVVAQPFRLVLSLRGPPHLSFA